MAAIAREPRVLAPQRGSAFLLADELIIFKAVGAETAGVYTLFERHNEPGCGLPPHIHWHQEAAFFVLEGAYSFGIGERLVELGPGGFVFGPRGIPHSFRCIGPGHGRLLTLITPGGLFERFAAELGQPLAAPTNRRPAAGLAARERLVAVAAKYGIDFLPPAVSADDARPATGEVGGG